MKKSIHRKKSIHVVKRDWKRMFCMTLLAAMLLPGRAFAESGDGFRLDSSGQVTLDSDHAAKEGISSLCFSLTVEAGTGDTVTFEFSGSNASVAEYRYDANQKKMNIYMAGTDPLFAGEAQSLDIGRVVIHGGDGGEGSAVVGVAEGSLQYVYGSKAKTMEGVSNPEAVQLGTPMSTVTPPPEETLPPDSTQTPPPEETQTPPPASPPPATTQTPGGGTGESGGWQQPTDGTQSAGGSNQPGGGTQPVVVTKRPVNSAQPSTVSPSPERTPVPSASPSPSPIVAIEKVELNPSGNDGMGSEDSAVTAPADGTEERSGDGAGFWESVKPVLIGFAIAASVTGGAAALVLYLIKGPKGKW